MTKDERFKDMPLRLLKYFGGLFIMTAGIAFSVLSDLGVSPLSSLPYAVELCGGIEMGAGTSIMHAGFVLIQILLLRKRFRPVMLLQVPVGIVFGWFTTLCNSLVGMIPRSEFFPLQLLFQLVSIILVAVGIHFYLPANIMPLAGEGIVSAITEVSGWQFGKVKIGFDSATVIIAAVICFIGIGKLGSVGIGTVLSALLTGTFIAWIDKFFGKKKSHHTSGSDPEHKK
ncbi:MAG: hypothetical protein IK990_07690 [Ruminiclostridium sp.]|nr:hypothetical protein [Ruminiclostridium sp.]